MMPRPVRACRKGVQKHAAATVPTVQAERLVVQCTSISVQKCAKAMRAAHEKIHPAGRLGRAGYIQGYRTSYGKTNTKTNTRGSGQRGGRRRAKPKPDMNARWSILLFGIGVLVFALIVVPGASVWNWVRTNILFGVFGVGSYVLAPMLLYIAVLVACERPVKGKLAKALLVLMLVCGTFLIFSKTDLTGLGFWEGMAVLRSTGASEWGLGGGMLGAVFGWTLLLLCGRPGANILIVIFMLMGLMLFTGVTPADIWYFFSGHAGRMKDSMDRRADARAQLREARAQEAEQARLAAEEEARRHPLPAGDDRHGCSGLRSRAQRTQTPCGH